MSEGVNKTTTLEHCVSNAKKMLAMAYDLSRIDNLYAKDAEHILRRGGEQIIEAWRIHWPNEVAVALGEMGANEQP